jgi:N-acetylglucosaminyldiphosphoundecaprenol N-acetyl-beta-D-mannosaminyltransferase
MRMRNPNQAPTGAELVGIGASAARVVPALKPVAPDPNAPSPLPDDLSREVHCVLGMPIDAVDMRTALQRIRTAAEGETPFLVSTANLNFLVSSLRDGAFRDSLTLSDLCTADGFPIIWIARFLGIPLAERVAGSDLFDDLAAGPAEHKLGVFFFGGSPGAADAARRKANAKTGLKGVGAIYPGYGTVAELSSRLFIDAINASKAQFLVVALGAAKGQAWLTRNHERLRVPVRAHLGATINFQAGDVRRAPRPLRRGGLEWLWRIKEEPRLWRRYVADGRMLLRLLFTHVLPLARQLRRQRSDCGSASAFDVETLQGVQVVTLRLSGDATAQHIARAIVHFRNAINLRKNRLVVDLSRLDFIDTRFLGMLLMVRKQMNARGADLKLVGAAPGIEKMFRLNALGYLLSAGRRT